MNEEKIKLVEERLKNAEMRLEKALKEQGEACGDACDWHDNNAYDLAMSLSNTYQVMVNDLKEELKNLKKQK